MDNQYKGGRAKLQEKEKKTLVGTYIENYKIDELGGKDNVRLIMAEAINNKYKKVKK